MRKDDRSQGRLQRAAFPVVTNENEALRLNMRSAARLFRPASTVTKFPRQTGVACHAGHKESGGRPTEPFTETRRNRQPSAGNQPGNDNPDNSRKKRTVSFETAFREYGRPVHSITVTKPDTPETRSAFYRERSPAIRSPFTRKKHRPRRKTCQGRYSHSHTAETGFLLSAGSRIESLRPLADRSVIPIRPSSYRPVCSAGVSAFLT